MTTGPGIHNHLCNLRLYERTDLSLDQIDFLTDRDLRTSHVISPGIPELNQYHI